MRHAAITFAKQVNSLAADQTWDAVFCTDMCNLAEFAGLTNSPISELPRILYFHESQLTYPDDYAGERDLHFAFTNFTSALAADAVWFNSAFHRDVFLSAMKEHLSRMPDERLTDHVAGIEDKSSIQEPGIDPMPIRPSRQPGPVRLVWAARWEHDKGPELLFTALGLLRDRGTSFEVSVLGQSFGATPSCFDVAKVDLNKHIKHWGFVDRPNYQRVLLEADVFVSTAKHEFFGIAAVEAMAAGCIPVVPEALAYPEVIGEFGSFYESNNADALADAIDSCSRGLDDRSTISALQQHAIRYHWADRAVDMDNAVEALVGKMKVEGRQRL